MMYVTLLVLLSAFSAALATNATATCNRPPKVESFAAAYYTALVVTYGSDFVNNLKLEGGEAALRLFIAIKQVAVDSLNLCDGASYAFTSSRPLALLNSLSLNQYFYLSGYTYGELLNTLGVLNCQNSIQLAIEFSGYVNHEIKQKKLDSNQFQSYFVATVNALKDFAVAHKLNLEKVFATGPGKFNNEVNRLPKKVCSGHPSSRPASPAHSDPKSKAGSGSGLDSDSSSHS